MPTPADKPLSPAAKYPDLPKWTGPTLEPKLMGFQGFADVMQELVPHLPNLELFRERRLHEPGPVPVRFQV